MDRVKLAAENRKQLYQELTQKVGYNLRVMKRFNY